MLLSLIPLISLSLATTTSPSPSSTTTTSTTQQTPSYFLSNASAPCYASSLPPNSTTSQNITRSIPWGKPSVQTTIAGFPWECCGSLDQVRTAIDIIDEQLLSLISQRIAYVAEATRFKATLGDVSDASRNEAVVESAVEDGREVGVPETVARGIFEALLGVAVGFEECLFNTYQG